MESARLDSDNSDEDENSFHSADEGDSSDSTEGKTKAKGKRHVAAPVPKRQPEIIDVPTPITPMEPVEVKTIESPMDDTVEWDDWETKDVDVEPISHQEEKLIEAEKEDITAAVNSLQSPVTQPQSLKLSATPNQPPTADNLHSVLDKLNADKSGSSFWTGWNSILSVASDSLTTLGNSVGEGLSSVLETVETTLGAPTPEELAKMSLEEKLELKKKVDNVKEPWPKEDKDDCDSAEEFASDGMDEVSSGYQSDTSGSLPSKYFPPETGAVGLSGMTQLKTVLNEKGMKLVTGSIDALELIGKKTFNVLTEKQGDTGRRRLIFNKEKSSLSQALRELKDKNDSVPQKQMSSSTPETPQVGFTSYFEKHNGFANLEALEMLSKSSKEQLQVQLRLSSSCVKLTEKLSEIQSTLDSTNTSKSEFGTDFEDFMDDCEFNIGPYCNAAKLKEVEKKFSEWLEEVSSDPDAKDLSVEECSDVFISFLAEFTSTAIEAFRKYSQLVAADKPKSEFPCAYLSKFRNCVSDRISSSANSVSQLLNSIATLKDAEDSASRCITDVFLEADNCNTSIGEAFLLITPVLQLSTARSLAL